MMQGITDLHHDIFFFLILILVFVSRILVRALSLSCAKDNCHFEIRKVVAVVFFFFFFSINPIKILLLKLCIQRQRKSDMGCLSSEWRLEGFWRKIKEWDEGFQGRTCKSNTEKVIPLCSIISSISLTPTPCVVPFHVLPSLQSIHPPLLYSNWFIYQHRRLKNSAF